MCGAISLFALVKENKIEDRFLWLYTFPTSFYKKSKSENLVQNKTLSLSTPTPFSNNQFYEIQQLVTAVYSLGVNLYIAADNPI